MVWEEGQGSAQERDKTISKCNVQKYFNENHLRIKHIQGEITRRERPNDILGYDTDLNSIEDHLDSGVTSTGPLKI